VEVRTGIAGVVTIYPIHLHLTTCNPELHHLLAHGLEGSGLPYPDMHHHWCLAAKDTGQNKGHQQQPPPEVCGHDTILTLTSSDAILTSASVEALYSHSPPCLDCEPSCSW